MAGLSEALLVRLRSQLDALPLVLGDASEERLRRRPTSGAWSAHENLAHLARHHEVMIERIERILREDRPALARYRAEEDPRWAEWAARGSGEVLTGLRGLRARLVAAVEALDAEEAGRVGVHSSFGPLRLSEWLEFFLIHEGHHLYVALTRARR
ncbi:MAG TPA: DinB family protein [Vicinamibacteria bacterium]|nr:DinB family protein [Vicinamibacteria bacterium]